MSPEGAAQFLRDTRNRIEHLTIIPIIEGIYRLWYHLNLRVYVSRLRLRSVTEGHAPIKSKKFVVFVLYTRWDIPSFTQNAIAAIARSDMNLVIVSNGSIGPSARERLESQCYLLIERENLGRDFGAYKDGIDVILKRHPEIERLVLLNDSLFFFERGLDKLFSDLSAAGDFVGLTEVFEYHYHVQSFMLSFSRRVLQHPKFKKFWKTYRPISTRRWSIHKGEVALTRLVTKAGFEPRVLFHGAELIEHLRTFSMEELLDAIALLPSFFRQQMHEHIQELDEGENARVASPIAAALGIVRSLAAAENDSVLKDVRRATVHQLKSLSSRATSIERRGMEDIWRKIISIITTRNQMHVGGFLFMRYLGMPAIKRDILYRAVYNFEDIYQILGALDEPLLDDVLADLRRTGTVEHFGLYRRLLFRHGSI